MEECHPASGKEWQSNVSFHSNEQIFPQNFHSLYINLTPYSFSGTPSRKPCLLHPQTINCEDKKYGTETKYFEIFI
jgi:hypothetical protein